MNKYDYTHTVHIKNGTSRDFRDPSVNITFSCQSTDPLTDPA